MYAECVRANTRQWAALGKKNDWSWNLKSNRMFRPHVHYGNFIGVWNIHLIVIMSLYAKKGQVVYKMNQLQMIVISYAVWNRV